MDELYGRITEMMMAIFTFMTGLREQISPSVCLKELIQFLPGEL